LETGEFWPKAALATAIAANQKRNFILRDSKWLRYSQQDQTPGGILPAGLFLTRDYSAVEEV
jgi:hypothetical protein